jgi:hypothetical protein
MKTNFASVSNDTPTAFITKNRQRIKQYPTNIVYLKNGDEFEIELFNPTQTKILAQIEINGVNISTSGIVIKPGQRVYLERYLDVAKKFLFETYEIDATDQAAQDAILNNGVVSVKFSKEVVPNNIWYRSYGNNTLTVYPPFNCVYGEPFNYRNLMYHSDNSSGSVTRDYSTLTGTLSSVNTTYTSSIQPISMSASIETGRVEKGSQSNQNFTTDYSNYGNVFSTTIWKILPESVKPIEVRDLTIYCSSCGSKRKKPTHKFCPNCGTQF